MDIRKVGFVSRQQSVNSASRAKPAASAKLSQEEMSMIKEKFPASDNGKLKLYLATGGHKMENPNARGNNLDFRV